MSVSPFHTEDQPAPQPTQRTRGAIDSTSCWCACALAMRCATPVEMDTVVKREKSLCVPVVQTLTNATTASEPHKNCVIWQEPLISGISQRINRPATVSTANLQKSTAHVGVRHLAHHRSQLYRPSGCRTVRRHLHPERSAGRQMGGTQADQSGTRSIRHRALYHDRRLRRRPGTGTPRQSWSGCGHPTGAPRQCVPDHRSRPLACSRSASGSGQPSLHPARGPLPAAGRGIKTHAIAGTTRSLNRSLPHASSEGRCPLGMWCSWSRLPLRETLPII